MAPFTFPDNLIKETQKLWGKKLKRKISEYEAKEIILSFSNFLMLLSSVKKGV